MSTTVHLQGAIEPLMLAEPLDATALNMSAAAQNNLLFFIGNDTGGHRVMIAIPKVLYMRDEND